LQNWITTASEDQETLTSGGEQAPLYSRQSLHPERAPRLKALTFSITEEETFQALDFTCNSWNSLSFQK